MDEYDSIVEHRPFLIHNSQLFGLWQLKNLKVIAFSATSCKYMERLVTNCINDPVILNFESEYSVCHGADNIQDGHIVACERQALIYPKLEDELNKYYDSKPLVVIYEEGQLDIVKHIIHDYKYTYYLGTSSETLFNIKD